MALLLLAPFIAGFLWRRSGLPATAHRGRVAHRVRRDVRTLTHAYAVHLIREAEQCDAILHALFDKAGQSRGSNNNSTSSSSHSSSGDVDGGHNDHNKRHKAPPFVYAFPKCVIGFDAEWQPTKGSRVALVQIALPMHCLLIQIHHMNTLPRMLHALLESRDVIKVGVGVSGDAHRMSRDWGVNVTGCVDLRNLASFRSATFGAGLKTMTEGVLGLHYPSELVAQQRSDWQAPHLTQAQLDYATADAVVGWHIAHALWRVTAGTEESLATPTIAAEDLGASAEWLNFHGFCEVFEGQPLPKSASHAPPNMKEASEPVYRPSKTIPTSTSRKRPMHENVRIVSYDGRVLGYTSRKRIAKGIVSRGEGEYAPASEGPWDPIAAGYHASRTIVKLTDPRTSEWAETDAFMRHPKRNKCCVCGACGPNCRRHEECVKAPGGLSAHKVIPTQYYRYLTQKEYVHDTLLVCNVCGDRIRFLYRGETDRVAARFNAPLHGINDKAQLRQNPDYQARTYAKTLLDMMCGKFGVTEERPQKEKKKKAKKDATEDDGAQTQNIQNTTAMENASEAAQQQLTTSTTSEEEAQQPKGKRAKPRRNKREQRNHAKPTEADGTSSDNANKASDIITTSTPLSTPTPTQTPLGAAALPTPPASTTRVVTSMKDLTLSEEDLPLANNTNPTPNTRAKHQMKKKGGSKAKRPWRPSGASPSEWLAGAGPAVSVSSGAEASSQKKQIVLPTGAGIDREACVELFNKLPSEVQDKCVMGIQIRIPRRRVREMARAIIENEVKWAKKARGETEENDTNPTPTASAAAATSLYEGGMEKAAEAASSTFNDDVDDNDYNVEGCGCPCPEHGICVTPRILLECLIRDDTHLSFVPHGWLVMQHVIDDAAQSFAFVRRWRQFFIDSVQPKRLPVGWNVEYVAPDTELTTLLISDPDTYDGYDGGAGEDSEGEITDEES